MTNATVDPQSSATMVRMVSDKLPSGSVKVISSDKKKKKDQGGGKTKILNWKTHPINEPHLLSQQKGKKELLATGAACAHKPYGASLPAWQWSPEGEQTTHREAPTSQGRSHPCQLDLASPWYYVNAGEKKLEHRASTEFVLPLNDKQTVTKEAKWRTGLNGCRGFGGIMT